ncbi:paraquat-inducible protein A [Ahrensia sp. 13_GOM-1096m]|uniref:paraquat-inducible protein A n=1 Tax=Ahrensia sp. 13_GOM-1096m TaxID=1380380 RepID=UPI0006883A00|nr:paraquat-inducible protein A [Ahrensia sp. 13_GOM-1096m]
MRILAGLLITIAAFCFALGTTLPLLQMERLFFLTDRPSLFAIVNGLFSSGDIALGLLVGGVSLAFPATKLLALAGMLSAKNLNQITAHRAGTWLGIISKWSMLDVLLVALTIFAAKTSGLAAAISQPGLWFFAASTLTSAIAASIVKRELNQDAKAPPSLTESDA